MSLEDKVVLITGAARGMGREYVRGFLKEGARVIATDVSWAPTGVSNDKVDFREELRDNEDVLVETMDITVESHIKRIYQAAISRFGQVDVILNNAGMRSRDVHPPHGQVTIMETEVSDWRRMFETHVFGSLQVLKAFVPDMMERKSGSIINVTSSNLATQTGVSREGSYQPAKAALATMTVYLATELKPYNIAANAILPGHTASTGTEEQEGTRKQMRAAKGEEQRPLRRLRPDAQVPLALFLAQQDASGVTGQQLSALQWNEEHGLGGFETWGYEEDVRAAGLRT